MGLLKFPVRHTGVGLEGVGGAAALVHTHIKGRACQASLQSAKENGELIGLHILMLGN